MHQVDLEVGQVPIAAHDVQSQDVKNWSEQVQQGDVGSC